jgi:hypothetical protein
MKLTLCSYIILSSVCKDLKLMCILRSDYLKQSLSMRLRSFGMLTILLEFYVPASESFIIVYNKSNSTIDSSASILNTMSDWAISIL